MLLHPRSHKEKGRKKKIRERFCCFCKTSRQKMGKKGVLVSSSLLPLLFLLLLQSVFEQKRSFYRSLAGGGKRREGGDPFLHLWQRESLSPSLPFPSPPSGPAANEAGRPDDDPYCIKLRAEKASFRTASYPAGNPVLSPASQYSPSFF